MGSAPPWFFPKKYVVAKKKLWKRSAIGFLISLTKKLPRPSKVFIIFIIWNSDLCGTCIGVFQCFKWLLLKNLSLIPIIMKIREKKMTTLCIGNCSTATRLQKIWTKSKCHCCSALDGCSTFLVRDIKKLIALLFHSFFLAITYFLRKIHGETKPNLTFF